MRKALSFFLVLTIVVSVLYGCTTNDSSQETASQPASLEESTVSSNPEPTNTEISYGFLDYTMFSFYLTDGTFRCGDDFEPGDYYIMSLYGSNAQYDVSETPDGFSWSSHRMMRKVYVEEGQYVELSGAILVSADEVDTSNWAKYGVFLVGKDLPAGDYRIVTISDKYSTEIQNISGIKGAYQICNDSPENEPVSCTPLFEKQSYITLETGQYLVINNAKLTLCGSESSQEPEDSTSLPTENITETITPETESPEVSATYSAYITATTLTKANLKKETTATGTKYYYQDLPLLSEDVEWIESSINKEGTVNQGAIYRKLAKLLEGYAIHINNGNGYSKYIFSDAVSIDEFGQYATIVSEFITNEDSLYHVLKKFESLECVEGNFDYVNNSWSFSITDLTQCAEEMQISEEMLGYIFAMLDEYAPTIAFDGNSCTFEYKSMFDFDFEEQKVAPISKEDFLAEIPVGSNAVNIYDNMISDGYASFYCYYDSSADPSKDGVIKTNRDIHLGDSKATVISKYGEANSNTFIMQSNVLYQDLLEYSPAEAGIMRSQCSTYIAYAYENLGAIEFYFDENDCLSWIVFYAY